MKRLAAMSAVLLAGCVAAPDRPAAISAEDVSALARFASLPPCPARTEIILALSGGGSRAAVFATEFLFALDQIPCRVRDNITIVTGVSGGSIAAALYASSFDWPNSVPKDRLLWTPSIVRPRVMRSIGGDALRELAKPGNAVGYLTGSYSRTKALEAAIDRVISGAGKPLTFGDLNPRRPKTIIGATVASDGRSQVVFPFGGLFAFDRETFKLITGDWDLSYDYEGKGAQAFKSFPVSRAVAASSAFPAAFDFVTLYYPRTGPQSGGGGRYIHLFDGGNFDNLGLFAVKRALLQNKRKFLERPEKLIIISVDAAGTAGASEVTESPRTLMDSVGVNVTSLLTSFDALLLSKKDRIVAEFREGRFQAPEDRVDCLRQGLEELCFNEDFDWDETNALFKKKALFVHFHFRSRETSYAGVGGDFEFKCRHRELIERVSHISTKLSITQEEAEDLRLVNALFMGEWNLCYGDILAALGLETDSVWRQNSLYRLDFETQFLWLDPMQHLPSCNVPSSTRYITLANGERLDMRRTRPVNIRGEERGEIRYAWSMMQSAIAKAELGDRECSLTNAEAGRELLWSAVQASREHVRRPGFVFQPH